MAHAQAANNDDYRAGLKSLRLLGVYDQFAGTDIASAHMVAAAAVLRAHRIVSIRVDAALAALDLSMPRYEVLGLLASSENGRLGFGELKRATLLHSATMTYTVDTLEERKLIRRKRDPKDRRALVAEITAKGRDVVTKATAALNEIRFGMGDLDEAAAKQVALVLSELHNVAD
jgi:DNA-binding MarR family transcriptional regulator